MKFFLDENSPKSAAVLLGARGHECFDIRGTDMEGCDDIAIFPHCATACGCFSKYRQRFLSHNTHIERQHYGVVVVALRQPDRRSIMSRLEWFLDHFENEDVSNTVFELRDRTYVRLPLS